jgi:hypothetical protein
MARIQVYLTDVGSRLQSPWLVCGNAGATVCYRKVSTAEHAQLPQGIHREQRMREMADRRSKKAAKSSPLSRLDGGQYIRGSGTSGKAQGRPSLGFAGLLAEFLAMTKGRAGI